MTPGENAKSMRGQNKRNALLRTAWEVFAEQGYQTASMDMVVARAGGSKQTLYNYFKSKEELLKAVLDGRREDLFDRVYRSFEIPGDFVGSLWKFSTGYLNATINSDLIELYRLAIAESKTLDLGQWMYSLGFVKNWQIIADYLATHIDPALLPENRSWTAAMHLRGLLENDNTMQRLCGIITSLPPREIARTTHAALTTFLRAYHPESVAKLPGLEALEGAERTEQ